MNERIAKLREQSLKAITRISPERARLITEFYESDRTETASVPLKRAMAFKYILLNKKIYIGEDELIVGERGSEPKATPTFPEICLHSLEDLNVLNSRDKVPFAVDEQTKKIYRDYIIPFWQGKTIRDYIFRAMEPAWIESYQAGIFTEFQEQRAPGHTVCGNKIYLKGFLDIKADIKKSLDSIDYYNDSRAYDKVEQLHAMEIVADALIQYAQRHAEKLEELSKTVKDAHRKKELIAMAAICRRVPAYAPTTFHEALQYYWFVHLGVIMELNPWDAFNPGRLDQHLLSFYKSGFANKTLNEEKARELLQAFWIKFNNHPAPPKIGVTAAESSTYTDFCLINLGGVNSHGGDAVNELSYLILDVIEEMRLLQPSSMIQVSKINPDHFLKRAIEIIKTGFGQPSIFNCDAIIEELLRQGKSIEDARNGGASGCVEAGAFGTESYILTGYLNLVKIFEVTLYNGIDPRTGKQIGLASGDSTKFKNFTDLLAAYEKQLNHFIDIKIKGNNIIDRIYAKYMPVPFLSLLIDDCIKNGKDYNDGGARYNTSYIQGVGLGSITDILTAVRFHVYDKKNITLEELLTILRNNFKGYENIRNDFLNHTPKYGNDDDYADDNAVKIFNFLYNAINGRPTTKGGSLRLNLLPTTSHVYFGRIVGAMPDGRKAGRPLSEGISPVQGADRKGPTAVLKSAAKIDHIKTGGTLLNQKFTPSFFKDEESIQKLVYLIRSYFRMNGHHIQFNVVDAGTLRKAQRNPEDYRDLIVRVAGYSDYFCDLGKELQNEIIARTEQGRG